MAYPCTSAFALDGGPARSPSTPSAPIRKPAGVFHAPVGAAELRTVRRSLGVDASGPDDGRTLTLYWRINLNEA